MSALFSQCTQKHTPARTHGAMRMHAQVPRRRSSCRKEWLPCLPTSGKRGAGSDLPLRPQATVRVLEPQSPLHPSPSLLPHWCLRVSSPLCVSCLSSPPLLILALALNQPCFAFPVPHLPPPSVTPIVLIIGSICYPFALWILFF